jgi:hypothetical protein
MRYTVANETKKGIWKILCNQNRTAHSHYCLIHALYSLRYCLTETLFVQVYHVYGFGFHKKLLGCVRFDVATVWKQPGEYMRCYMC